MLSVWESELESTDVAIVGAGIIGLTTAINIKTKYPNLKIVVFERGIMSGATTRNAGFATFGSALEILDDIDNMGEDRP